MSRAEATRESAPCSSRQPPKSSHLHDESDNIKHNLRHASDCGYSSFVMLKRDYEGQVCSIARALEVVGDRWTLLIIRDIALGRRRFDQLLVILGIASNVLSERLSRLVDEGVLDRVAYSERPERFEYRLTEKGG